MCYCVCTHPYVHRLAEQIQGSLMSLHWPIKTTMRHLRTPYAMYIPFIVSNYNALLLSFINHSFLTRQRLSWHLKQYFMILDCWNSIFQKYHMSNVDIQTLIDLFNKNVWVILETEWQWRCDWNVLISQIIVYNSHRGILDTHINPNMKVWLLV